MQYRDFTELPIWKESRNLVCSVYGLCNGEPGISRDFGFRDQIQRAAISIMNNIAEGFDSSSNRGFARYLTYSIQSCGEVISMTFLAGDLFGLKLAGEEIRAHTISLKKQNKGFRKYLVEVKR